MDEIGRYRRKLDDSGTPTAQILNKKRFHLMDCARYLIAHVDHFDQDQRRQAELLDAPQEIELDRFS